MKQHMGSPLLNMFGWDPFCYSKRQCKSFPHWWVCSKYALTQWAAEEITVQLMSFIQLKQSRSNRCKHSLAHKALPVNIRIRELMWLFTVGIVNSTRNALRRSSHDHEYRSGSARSMHMVTGFSHVMYVCMEWGFWCLSIAIMCYAYILYKYL